MFNFTPTAADVQKLEADMRRLDEWQRENDDPNSETNLRAKARQEEAAAMRERERLNPSEDYSVLEWKPYTPTPTREESVALIDGETDNDDGPPAYPESPIDKARVILDPWLREKEVMIYDAELLRKKRDYSNDALAYFTPAISIDEGFAIFLNDAVIEETAEDMYLSIAEIETAVVLHECVHALVSSLISSQVETSPTFIRGVTIATARATMKGFVSIHAWPLMIPESPIATEPLHWIQLLRDEITSRQSIESILQSPCSSAFRLSWQTQFQAEWPEDDADETDLDAEIFNYETAND